MNNIIYMIFNNLELYLSSLHSTALGVTPCGAFISLLLISSSHFWQMAPEIIKDEQKSISNLIMEIINAAEDIHAFYIWQPVVTSYLV